MIKCLLTLVVMLSNLQGCEDRIIITIDSINSTDLDNWDVVYFHESCNTSEKGLILISKDTLKLDDCIQISNLEIGDEIAVPLVKEFYYFYDKNSIGIRLYGRFDVETKENGEVFVFKKNVPVYKCKKE